MVVSNAVLSKTFIPATNKEKIENAPCPCGKGIERWTYFAAKAQAHFWQAEHAMVTKREQLLKKELEKKEAELRLLKQKFYGKRTESSKKNEKLISDKKLLRKPRGQQKDSKGHGRGKKTKLPIVEEFIELPDDEKCCKCCGLPYAELASTEDSVLIEVHVRGYVRKIKRKKYKRNNNCKCDGTKKIITAPLVNKIIKKGLLGISVWAFLLTSKYADFIPTYRTVLSLENHDISLAQGTITDGFKKLSPLFSPIYDAFLVKSHLETHWHADETRWEVFEEIEDKVTNRWYLWIFLSKSVAIYIIDPSRGYSVPEGFFKNVKSGILNCDRYIVYKKLAKNGYIILAFCWAHTRRDFLDLAKSEPKLEDWALNWVKDIGNLYHLNKKRLSLTSDKEQYKDAQLQLEQAVKAIDEKCSSQLAHPELHDSCQNILNRLKNHWQGLTVFVEHPEIPMDNNDGESGLRGPVVGRKNFYGSGSIWSAHFAAVLFSVMKTLKIWNINQITWVNSYLQACADNNGTPPEDLSPFLPWGMSKEELVKMSSPMPAPTILDTS